MTIGVEEEFYLVDGEQRKAAEHGLTDFPAIQRRHGRGDGDPYGIDAEFHKAIVETRTGVCVGLDQIRGELRALRKCLADEAAVHGLSILAAGTLPTTSWLELGLVRSPRYDATDGHFADVTRRRATCGCHIHVGIPDRELAVAVLNRVRRWLPVLLAVSASSPFFAGRDTGYESYRSILWGGFPIAGPPGEFTSHTHYQRVIERLIGTGAVLDSGHVYWDVRLGTKYDTLEFRVSDVSPSLDVTILLVALARALVFTCVREVNEGKPDSPVPMEHLRAAIWCAGRFGLSGRLVDPWEWTSVPAMAVVDAMVSFVRDGLEQAGDWAETGELLDVLRGEGTVADRQRRLFQRTGSLESVVDELVVETRKHSDL